MRRRGWAGRRRPDGCSGAAGFEGDEACHAALRRHEVELVQDDAVTLEGNRGDLRCVVLTSGRRIDCELQAPR